MFLFCNLHSYDCPTIENVMTKLADFFRKCLVFSLMMEDDLNIDVNATEIPQNCNFFVFFLTQLMKKEDKQDK